MERGNSGRGGLPGADRPTWQQAEGAAALYVTDPRYQQYLIPFLGRPRSVGEAALEVGVGTGEMFYRVRRMLALGLLGVERCRPRRGRTVKLYRAVADEFFVPREHYPPGTTEPTLEALEVHLHRILTEGLVAATEAYLNGGPWGVRLLRTPDGLTRTEASPGPLESFDPFVPQAPAVLHETQLLRLNFADAKALQRELYDLVRRYELRAGAQGYLVRVSLAPLREDG